MNNIQKLRANTISSLLNRAIIMISGLILPRLILLYYGSEVNGLVNSITQFLSIITFLDLGVGSVVQSALYKPMANGDELQISKILKSAKTYFRRISYLLVIYIIFLIIFFIEFVQDESLSTYGTIFLIISISISQFAQYYFGIINEFLLNANQKGYVQSSTEMISVFLNLIISIILIMVGSPIYIVKLLASLIYLIRPIFLNYYVNKNYNLQKDIEVVEDPLPQRWSGMGQHIAYSVQMSTDITVLTLFSNLGNVSIYSVYSLVTNAIKLFISSFTVGLQSFFGNLLANNEIKKVNEYFSKIEWVLHTLITFLYSMTAILITPFVLLYTDGVEDLNYFRPIFSIVLVMSSALFSLRIPYQAVVFSYGHYKQTQKESYIEAGLNILLSLIFVNFFGLVGVAIGSLIALTYRLIFLVRYLSKNILYRSRKTFLKNIIIDTISFLLILFFGNVILKFVPELTLTKWVLLACGLGIIAVAVILIVNSIFYKEYISWLISKYIKRGR